MALTRSNLAVVTQSASRDQKFSFWLYKTTDTLAATVAAGYFGDVVAEGVINENDLIFVIASNGVRFGRLINTASPTTIAVSAVPVS